MLTRRSRVPKIDRFLHQFRQIHVTLTMCVGACVRAYDVAPCCGAVPNDDVIISGWMDVCMYVWMDGWIACMHARVCGQVGELVRTGQLHKFEQMHGEVVATLSAVAEQRSALEACVDPHTISHIRIGEDAEHAWEVCVDECVWVCLRGCLYVRSWIFIE